MLRWPSRVSEGQDWKKPSSDPINCDLRGLSVGWLRPNLSCRRPFQPSLPERASTVQPTYSRPCTCRSAATLNSNGGIILSCNFCLSILARGGLSETYRVRGKSVGEGCIPASRIEPALLSKTSDPPDSAIQRQDLQGRSRLLLLIY